MPIAIKRFLVRKYIKEIIIPNKKIFDNVKIMSAEDAPLYIWFGI